MNVNDFTYLLQNPDTVVLPAQTKQLEDILKEYPYFQAARAVHLKGLRNLNNFKYNDALKTTAAHTVDREVLFDFITSGQFLQNSIANTILGRKSTFTDTHIVAEEVIASPEVKSIQKQDQDTDDAPLPKNTKDADRILDPSLFKSKDPKVDKDIAEAKKKAKKDLGIGIPISFTRKEQYSFKEWLQLTAVEKIERETVAPSPVETAHTLGETEPRQDDDSISSTKRKKFDLIDKFIENNPRIVPKDRSDTKNDIKADIKVHLKQSQKMDADELMTETLARVYLEQKKYKKAIQAFKILSLKYPEKSSFFADRIKAVEKLKKENK